MSDHCEDSFRFFSPIRRGWPEVLKNCVPFISSEKVFYKAWSANLTCRKIAGIWRFPHTNLHRLVDFFIKRFFEWVQKFGRLTSTSVVAAELGFCNVRVADSNPFLERTSLSAVDFGKRQEFGFCVKKQGDGCGSFSRGNTDSIACYVVLSEDQRLLSSDVNSRDHLDNGVALFMLMTRAGFFVYIIISVVLWLRCIIWTNEVNRGFWKYKLKIKFKLRIKMKKHYLQPHAPNHRKEQHPPQHKVEFASGNGQPWKRERDG